MNIVHVPNATKADNMAYMMTEHKLPFLDTSLNRGKYVQTG